MADLAVPKIVYRSVAGADRARFAQWLGDAAAAGGAEAPLRRRPFMILDSYASRATTETAR
jgi:hypothetical protein